MVYLLIQFLVSKFLRYSVVMEISGVASVGFSGHKASGLFPGNRHSGRVVSVIGSGLLMAAASACSAQTATSNAIELSCSVEGGKLLSSAITDDAVCGEIRREIDGALSRQTKTVRSIASTSRTDWIKIDVRFVQPATATAAIVQRVGGREIVHPEIAVDVMDKAFGPKEIKLLAAEIARVIGKSTKG